MGGTKDEEKIINEPATVKRTKQAHRSESTTSIYNDFEQKLTKGENTASSIVALPSYFYEDLGDLDERVKSMMEDTQSRTAVGGRMLIVCKVCGKEDQRSQIRNHIEANHFEGTSIPCIHCEKTFRSRHALECHKYRNHINQVKQ